MTAVTLQLQRGWSWLRAGDRGPLLLILLFALLLPIANPRVYATDEVQYYVYLRSLRFDGDLNFANDYQAFHQLNPRSGIDRSLLQPNRIRPTTGLYGNIAPVGSAIMWAPFFLLADLLVQVSNALGARIPADGFSAPYIYAVCYASALYGLLGLLLCYRLTRRYCSAFATSLASLAIWLATPLLFYMFVQMPFSHANGFFLVALFLTIWHDTRGSRSWRAWVALGAVGALMTITREQLGLFLLLPALEALGQYGSLLAGQRPPPTPSSTPASADSGLRGLARSYGGLLARHILFLCVFVLGLTPQLATYQVLNGSPRPASEVAGKLNWCSPHMIDTLLDYNPAPSAWCDVSGEKLRSAFAHGALVWSPVLLPALLGLVLLWRRNRALTASLALAFLAQTYVNGAFGSTWHLAASFGFRRLVECTPIFILGLALLIDWAALRIPRFWLIMPALLLIGWNGLLILNWAVLHPELRQGLIWPELWRWQFEAPGRIAAELRDLLFDRCELLDNGGGRCS